MIESIPKITIALLIAAWLTALGWLVTERNFEPALTSLALLASITTLYIDVWLSARNRRREILQAIVHEIYVNLGVFEDKKFSPNWTNPGGTGLTVYPRVRTSALDSAVSSGVFYTKQDRILVRLLSAWQTMSLELNQRLTITELGTFTNPRPEAIAAWREGLTAGTTLPQIKSALVNLATHLMDSYAAESGIDRNTILFDSAGKASS